MPHLWEAPVKVPTEEELVQQRGDDPRFEALMKRYAEVDARIAAAKREKSELEDEQQNLRQLLVDEVRNLGLARGSTLRVDGVGTFGFTTKRGWRVAADDRERLVTELIEEGSTALLTVGKKALDDWCADRLNTGRDVPEYVKRYEDRHVPRISLEKSR